MGIFTSHVQDQKEKARQHILYALAGTIFFMPLQLIAMEVCFILTLGLVIYYMARYGRPRQSSQPLNLPAICFGIVALLSLHATATPLRSTAFYIYTLGQYLALYYVVQTFVRGAGERKQLCYVFLLAAAAVTVCGFGQYILSPVETNIWVDKDAFPLLSRRMYAPLYNPNLLAQFLVIALCVSISVPCKHPYLVWGKRILTLALVGAVILTYSRGAWLALAALCLYLGWVENKRWWLWFLCVPLLFGWYHDTLYARWISLFSVSQEDTSLAMRWSMWKAALTMAGTHPILGIGWGEFKTIYPQYNWFIKHAGICIYHAHNMFLNILAETGMTGFFFFLWFYGGNWYYARCYDIHNHQESYIPLLMGGIIIGTTVCGIGDFDLFATQLSMTFWLWCGIFANWFSENNLRNNSH